MTTTPLDPRMPAPPGRVLAEWMLAAVRSPGRRSSDRPRQLRTADGELLPLDVDRWAGPVDRGDETLLARARGPVLDLGCGPGRLTAALHRRGVDVLGVDVLSSVPVLARRVGAPVHVADVLGPLPHEGRWQTVLLADGNVGIGGDAVRLLSRVRRLLAPGGQVLCELHPDDDAQSRRVRLECGPTTSAWFRWDVVGPAAVDGTAASAGLAVVDGWTAGDRRFAVLAAAA